MNLIVFEQASIIKSQLEEIDNILDRVEMCNMGFIGVFDDKTIPFDQSFLLDNKKLINKTMQLYISHLKNKRKVLLEEFEKL